jgi:hypothetical protein
MARLSLQRQAEAEIALEFGGDLRAQAFLPASVRQGAAKANQIDQRKDDNNPVGDGEYGISPARWRVRILRKRVESRLDWNGRPCAKRLVKLIPSHPSHP